MPIRYQQEFLKTVEKEIKPLLEEHWEEIAVNKDFIKLNPDWEAYNELENRGILYIFTAREEEELVGYFVVLVQKSLHYKDHFFATNDVIFVQASHRKGLTGANLVTFAEKCLKDDGVSLLVVNTKCHKPFDRLLSWLGFNEVERVYSKLLR